MIAVRPKDCKLSNSADLIATWHDSCWLVLCKYFFLTDLLSDCVVGLFHVACATRLLGDMHTELWVLFSFILQRVCESERILKIGQ